MQKIYLKTKKLLIKIKYIIIKYQDDIKWTFYIHINYEFV